MFDGLLIIFFFKTVNSFEILLVGTVTNVMEVDYICFEEFTLVDYSFTDFGSYSYFLI